MRNELYDNNYSNESLVIPATIWNNSNVKGIAKMMLALYKKMTKDGSTDIKNMTIRQSQILGTREKDIKWNQQRLIEVGAIELYNDVVGGEMLKYTFNPNPKKIELEKDTNSLF